MSAPRLTKGMTDALRAIAAGQGQFHKIVANRIAGAGLAAPQPVTLAGYRPNGRGWFVEHRFKDAADWLLTEAGAAAIGMEAR